MNPRLTHDLVRGTPIDIGGRMFVPEARVTTLTAREAIFGARATRISGAHVRRIRPTALIEQTPQGERRHPIGDPLRPRLIRLTIVAIAIPLILNALAERMSTRR